jgi:GGDEF domain-containing protein
LHAVLPEIEEHVLNMAAAVGVDTRQWPDLRDLLDEAHAALALAAESVVHDWLRIRSPLRAPDVANWQTSDCLKSAYVAPRPISSMLDAALNHATTGAGLTRRTFTLRNIDPQHGELDRELLSHISAAAARCRRTRRPLSLVLCEVDQQPQLVLDHGYDRLQRLMGFLERTIERLTDNRNCSLTLNDAHFAILLEDCGRAAALQIARELCDTVRDRGSLMTGIHQAISLSAGVAALAVTPRNFAAEDLVVAAHRCLHAAQSSGGGMTKSIDLM